MQLFGKVSWIQRTVGWISGCVLCVGLCPAASTFVGAGGDLQAALNQARSGDTITLQAGASWTGHFRVPNNSGNKITIQSSGMGALPAGQRVTPAQAGQLAKLITPDANAALMLYGGANNYLIQGLEITENPGVYVQDLIQSGSAAETSVAALPQNITFDRDYIHGDPRSGGKRGLALNSASTTISNCYFADFISTGQDTQAIAGWNGAGPFTITNNHLESGTEILAFGGAVPAISGLIPSNITVDSNEFYKPTRYYEYAPDYGGIRVWAKNHLELKNAQNVTISNNTFTNNFVQADQLGCTLLLNVRDEGGQVPWATVSNVTVKNNIFQHVAGGILFMGHDGDGGGTAGNFTIQDNLWTDLGVYGGDGRLYEILNDVRGIKIDHETALQPGWLLVFDQGRSSGITVTNSIFTNGWGIGGTGCGAGESVMVCYDNDGSFTNNALINANPYYYTGAHFASNQFISYEQAGFAPDYSLTAASTLHGLATDGGDLGKVSAVQAQVAAPGIPTGWVTLVSKATGQCLSNPSGSLNGGTQMIQWNCWHGDDQKWQFTPVAGGYKLTNYKSGLQMDVSGGPGVNWGGASVIQYAFWGGTNEIWQVTPTNDGYYTIAATSSQQCLAIPGSSQNQGTGMIQWSCYGGDEQKWKIVP